MILRIIDFLNAQHAHDFLLQRLRLLSSIFNDIQIFLFVFFNK